MRTVVFLRPSHPQALKNEWEADQFRLERVYGAHAAWERRMERAVLAQVQRLPGVPSSHVGLDHVLGRDERIGFEDVLNRAWCGVARRGRVEGRCGCARTAGSPVSCRSRSPPSLNPARRSAGEPPPDTRHGRARRGREEAGLLGA